MTVEELDELINSLNEKEAKEKVSIEGQCWRAGVRKY
jgi:hypothetical protein